MSKFEVRTPSDAEELEFQALWGAWAEVTALDVAELFADIDIAWWVAGGRAIEAFTGVRREHSDIDVSIFRDQVPRLRKALHGRLHIWSAGPEGIRPVDDQFPEVSASADQVWVRENAREPWLLDVLLNPSRDGQWVNRRDPAMALPLEQVTWVGADGVRYLNPELVLCFKAKLMRAKDRRDMAATLPLLTSDRRGVLRTFLEAHHAGHEWLGML